VWLAYNGMVTRLVWEGRREDWAAKGQWMMASAKSFVLTQNKTKKQEVGISLAERDGCQ